MNVFAGTPVNTGHERGIIRKLEEKLQRPLQWNICLLHFNELPLKHLFQKIDGRAIGPETFSGPIGRKLKICMDDKIIKFDAIDVSFSLPVTNSEDLSTDQKYLHDCFYAVKSGECSENLANRSPGKLNLSRWTTTANRILRHYMSKEKPSINVKILANYVMRVYIPFWFKVKTEKSIKDGARHIHYFIELTRYLDKKYLDVIDSTIARNAFFAHPESVLLSMITDKRRNIREDAINKILKARSECNNQGIVRRFQVPTLNFQASDYTDMVDLGSVTSPPALSHISSEELLLSVDNIHWDFNNFPNHTQAVERIIKLVTDVSSKHFGFENRDGAIRSILKSRQILPKNNSKFHLEQMVQSMDTD